MGENASSPPRFCLKTGERATFTPSPASDLRPDDIPHSIAITAAVLVISTRPRLVTSQLAPFPRPKNPPPAPQAL